MNIMKKVHDLLLGTDFDEEDSYEEFEEDVEEEPKRERPRESAARFESARGHMKAESKIVSIKSGASVSVMVTSPKNIEDASPVCDYVKDGNICVVNLEGVEFGPAQRIADFLSGAAYSLNGEIQRINNNIFMIAPANVPVNGDITETGTASILPWIASSFK
ncbi:MAG: cell division protein SepF [Clostridiales bacterium]|jgi:cell division inhibitor SepF|nr:cell division protein SepF [Clostridiales bacterium]